MTTTPAGWYPAPENDGRQRYWDGTTWTEHYAPGPATSPPPTGPAASAAAAAAAASDAPTYPGTPTGTPTGDRSGATPATGELSQAEKNRRTNKRTLKIAGVIVGAVIVLAIIGNLAGNDSTDTSNTASPTTPASQPTKKAKPKAPAVPKTPLQQLTDAVKKADADGIKVEPNAEGPHTYRVTFKVGDNLTRGMIRDGIAIDTFDIAEHAIKSGVPFKELWIEGTSKVVDKYGTESTDTVYRVWFSHATLDRINFDNINTADFDTVESLADSAVYLLPDMRK